MLIIPIAAVLNEDDRHFVEYLYQAYIRLMYYEAYKFYSEKNQAEELIQTAWIKLMEHLDTVYKLSPKKRAAYIVSIVRNTGIDDSRKKKTRNYLNLSELNDVFLDSIPSDTVVEEFVTNHISALELAEAINQLSPNFKYLLTAKYVLEKTDEEISEQLGIKPSSVRVYLLRAKQATLRILTEESLHEKSI